MAPGVEGAIAQCFASGKYSDLTICCGPEHNFKVHKNVVCPQSEYFSKAVDDGRFKEGQTGVVELPADDDPMAIKAMIDFFYTGKYNAPGQKSFGSNAAANAELTPKSTSKAKDGWHKMHGSGKAPPVRNYLPPHARRETPEFSASAPEFTPQLSDGQKHPLLLHLAVYSIADRIQHHGLKALAETNFSHIAQGSWQHEQFVEAIKAVYDISPPGPQGIALRNTVIAIAAQHAKEFFTNEAFKVMIREVTDFTADLSAALCGFVALNYASNDKGNEETFHCPNCANDFSMRVPEMQQELSCQACTTNRLVRKWRARYNSEVWIEES